MAELPAAEADAVRYLLSYFTAGEEALHLAVSEDGITFATLNGGRPFLRSRVGSQAIRDPFIGCDGDGRYHLLGTDGWRSASIVHSVSADLVSWSEPELLPVMGEIDGAFNAWAPEFFTDPDTGIHHIIWSSVVAAGLAQPDGEWVDPATRQQIWTCATKDFMTFGPSSVFFDPGFTVIDATVRADACGFLMAYKDERGENRLDTSHKTIRFARFDAPNGPILDLDQTVPAAPVEGPSFLRRGGELVVIFDRFLEGAYSAAVLRDGGRWEPSPLVAPVGARHGSILESDSDSIRILLSSSKISEKAQPSL